MKYKEQQMEQVKKTRGSRDDLGDSIGVVDDNKST